MAISGSGGAYYRNSGGAISAGLHAAWTQHGFVRASVAPSTANYRTTMSLIGDNGQSPHEQFYWNHMNGGFFKAFTHRNSGGGYTAAQMASSLSVDNWHSVGGTYDGTNARAYLNGVLDGTSASSGVGESRAMFIDAMASITSVGWLDVSSQFSEGQLAEYAVWNVALTADEMAALGKGMRAKRIRPQSLVFYAPMIRDVNDIRAGRNMSRLAGSDVYSDHPRVFG